MPFRELPQNNHRDAGTRWRTTASAMLAPSQENKKANRLGLACFAFFFLSFFLSSLSSFSTGLLVPKTLCFYALPSRQQQ
jgi:hypothetical protein